MNRIMVIVITLVVECTMVYSQQLAYSKFAVDIGLEVSGGTIGIKGLSNSGDGLWGESHAFHKSGVFGLSTHAQGWAGFFTNNVSTTTGALVGHADIGYGVVGDGGRRGVYGICRQAGPDNAAVWGQNDAVGGTAIVAKGHTTGLYAEGGTYAAYFYGTLRTDGTTSTNVLTITGGMDLAEPFETSTSDIQKGAVVIIDEEKAGRVKLSTKAYDKRVAGIISGANGINPGITLAQKGILEEGQNVALSGRVYVLADASNGSIIPGDLLTTSNTPGHAMKVTNYTKAQGAIIGKAMGMLEAGKGMVLVLVSLQ